MKPELIEHLFDDENGKFATREEYDEIFSEKRRMVLTEEQVKIRDFGIAWNAKTRSKSELIPTAEQLVDEVINVTS